jgi:hypothetical protein
VFAKDPRRRKARSGARNRAKDPRRGVRTETRPARRVADDEDARFVLYVEGARDREILGCWARRVDPALSRIIDATAVILGGRRPARAVADFEKRGGVGAGYRGLVVLDRDDHDAAAAGDARLSRAGLEVFVWSLRHIESYLLVPTAIRRMLGLARDDRTVEHFLEEGARADRASTTGASLHAKRILGAGGLLSEALGAELRAGDIARAMRREEIHDDVHELLERIAALSGRTAKGPEIVIRGATASDD